MNYTPDDVTWVKLPLELLKRQGISRRAAVLLSIIIDKCKKDKASLSATISSAELIERSGMSRRTVFRTLDELRALALIESTKTGRESVYKLTTGCVELCPKAVRDEHPKDTPRGSTPRPRARKPTAAELENASKYLAFVNNGPLMKEAEQDEKKNLH